MNVELVEVGGRGGVFHHTVALGVALAQEGHGVVLHTAADCELEPPGVAVCRCVRWSRRLPAGLRQGVTAGGFLARTAPHLARAGPDGVIHVQGLFHPALTASLIAIVANRRSRGRVVFSPHNTFARSGRASHARWLRRACTRADSVFVFSDADERVLAGWGVSAVRVPLVMWTPEPDAELVRQWRRRWGERPVALYAGQLRSDKRPELFVDVVAAAGIRGAVVGEDKGAATAVIGRISDRAAPVTCDLRYVSLPEFVAAVAAADVVVLPYTQASVSGPAAVAAAVGTPVVATAVGGVAEQVTHPVEQQTVAAYCAAVVAALAEGRRPAPPAAPCVARYVEAYRRVAASRRR